MLTRNLPERQALDLHAHLRGAQGLLGRDLGKIRGGKAKLGSKALGRAALTGLDKGFEFHAASVVDTKPTSQAFDSFAVTKQTGGVNVTETRRARLKAWFAKRTLPTDEKSYLSQLIGGKASFGEKAARRLESTYEMPPMYLDTPMEAEAPAPVVHARSDLLDAWEWLTPEQQQDFLGQIVKHADINKHAYEHFANAPTIGVRAREIAKAGKTGWTVPQRRKEDAK